MCLLFSSYSFANIRISQSIIDFWPEQIARQDISVFNEGSKRIFVEVTPYEIIKPGTENEKRSYEPNPEKRGLLVSPAKLILEPGEMKIVRFALLGSKDKERIYRTTIKPVPYGEIKSNQKIMVKVLVGYEVLVIARPKNTDSNIQVSIKEGVAIFTNTGNTNALLLNAVQCDSNDDKCTHFPAKRLYPGITHKIPLPYSASVLKYILSTGNKQQHFTLETNSK